MSKPIDLSEVDRGWDTLAPSRLVSDSQPPSDPRGAFGRPSERRLGLRVPAALWALLRDGDHSVYARAVEISATGVVLELMSGAERFALDHGREFELDLFVPGAPRPVHATVRPARPLGDLEAFELTSISAADRLTLAEHIDRLLQPRRSLPPPSSEVRRRPPPAWERFVRSAAAFSRSN